MIDGEAELLKATTLLFARPAVFTIGAVKEEDLPSTPESEIAFIGRSNVGKSSLLNAITGRKALARVSHTPGRTRQINFFRVDNRLTLVDLPGYGYAKVSKKERAGWGELIEAYLRGRVQLKRALVLIDGEVGLKPHDRDMFGFLDDCAISYQVVLTKIDKASTEELSRVRASVEDAMRDHAAMHPEILPLSSRTGKGVMELKLAIYPFASVIS